MDRNGTLGWPDQKSESVRDRLFHSDVCLKLFFCRTISKVSPSKQGVIWSPNSRLEHQLITSMSFLRKDLKTWRHCKSVLSNVLHVGSKPTNVNVHLQKCATSTVCMEWWGNQKKIVTRCNRVLAEVLQVEKLSHGIWKKKGLDCYRWRIGSKEFLGKLGP